ncbi:MAG: hypothetical protein LBH98_10255 [Chitinispirillales bacterium]|nr:hypothetical protein [Chitinispirillales bacterium]
MKKEKKRNAVIIAIIIIILLLLVLVKLYFEFRTERANFETIKKENVERIEKLNMRSLIDSLCNLYSDACSEFEKFANIGSLMIYADSLHNRQEFISLIDSLCQIDSVNCEKYKRFSNFNELKSFMMQNDPSKENVIDDPVERENLEKRRKKESIDSISGIALKKKFLTRLKTMVLQTGAKKNLQTMRAAKNYMSILLT